MGLPAATQRTSPPRRHPGFWAAAFSTVCALTFTLVFAAEAVRSPPSTVWQGMESYAASFSSVRLALVLVPSLLLAPSFVALVACVHGDAPHDKKVWSRIALAFAIVYATVASFNYTVQLIVVRGSLIDRQTEGLSLLVMGNPRSLFWGLAILGYNFYMALAAVLLVPTLGEGALERWVGRLFGVNAAASVAVGVVYFVTLDPYHPLGLVASVVWCLAFPAATTLLALRFRRGNV